MQSKKTQNSSSPSKWVLEQTDAKQSPSSSKIKSENSLEHTSHSVKLNLKMAFSDCSVKKKNISSLLYTAEPGRLKIDRLLSKTLSLFKFDTRCGHSVSHSVSTHYPKHCKTVCSLKLSTIRSLKDDQNIAYKFQNEVPKWKITDIDASLVRKKRKMMKPMTRQQCAVPPVMWL